MISKQTTEDVIKVLEDFKLHYSLTHASIATLLYKLGMVRGNKSFTESMIGLKMEWDQFVENDKKQNPQHPDKPLHYYLKDVQLMSKVFDKAIEIDPNILALKTPEHLSRIKLALMKAFRHSMEYPPSLKTIKECIDKAFQCGIYGLDIVWGVTFTAPKCVSLEAK